MVGHVLILLMPALISAVAWKRGSLDGAGAIGAFLLSGILYAAGGIRFLAVLLFFFLTSTFFTKVGGKEKHLWEPALYEKGGRRDIAQVLANGGAGLVMALLYVLTYAENAAVGVFAAFSACNADTWASELGSLSRRDPVSILTGKPVRRGMSGGVSSLGFLASAGGAFVVSCLYLLTFPVRTGPFGAEAIPVPPPVAGDLSPFLRTFGFVLFRSFLILAAGFLGSVLDSLLGALLQPAYLCSETGLQTEKRVSGGLRNTRIKGVSWMSNDMVNLVSALSVALICLFLAGHGK